MDPIIPKPKPFTEEQFKLNTDRRIKGALGGFDRGEMVDLIQKDLRKIEESGTMDYNDALKFIKERTQELKQFLENNPGEQMPSLPGFEEEERVNFLDGGDTEYNALVTKKYIELGGQEGTGMDIDKFAEEYFPKMADGGRIGFDKGSQGFQPGNSGFRKPGEVRNVKGKNQYSPLRTLEEVQKAIDDAPPITVKGKTFERNAKDLIADSSYVNKKKGGTQYITRKEFDKYKDKLKFKTTGPKNFGEETRKKARDKRRDFTKTRSSESLEKALAAPQKSKLNFHHAGFKESLTDLKNTMYIPGSPNRKMAKLFEDPLLKEMETFTKIFDDPKATTKQKQKAATDYLKNDRALRQKYPQFKNFKTRLSFRRTAFEPGIMFKEKLPDPSLAISNEPGMTLKGETSKSPRGKEIIKKAAERFGKFAKPIGKVALRAVSPFVPVLGTAGMVMGGADVAKAADQGMRNEELGIAYLAGPKVAQNYKDLKSRVKGKADETETYVP